MMLWGHVGLEYMEEAQMRCGPDGDLKGNVLRGMT